MFENFNFKPAHQPDPESPVEFVLRPLDSPMLFRLAKGFNRPEGLEYDDFVAVLERNVVGWSGLPEAYSPLVKRAFLAGEGNFYRLLWLGECAQELYNRQALKEPERKNS